jgi:hypothetical protein
MAAKSVWIGHQIRVPAKAQVLYTNRLDMFKLTNKSIMSKFT